MTPRIQRAIDVFLDALNDGTLRKGDCTMCAVGNLCRAANIPEIFAGGYWKDTAIAIPGRWSYLFFTDVMGVVQEPLKIGPKVIEAKRVLSYLEFTEEEVREIEHTFETNTNILHIHYDDHTPEFIKQDQIKGLEAVIKVMLGFEKQKDNVKEVFTKRAELTSCYH